MARVISNRRCVVCGRENVQLWTIDNLRKVVVTYLCKDDAAPLLAIMDLAGDLPPDRQVPVPDRGKEPPIDNYPRGRRMPEMVPLDWTPPPPPNLPPE